MKIYHLSAECYPIAKVGGLADVLGALPKYLNQLEFEASVVMPWYDRPFVHENKFEIVFENKIQLKNLKFQFKIFKEKTNKLGFELFLIKIDGLTDRKEVYGYDDASLQFIGFQTAALNWIQSLEVLPDIIHSHDHHCGLVPFMMKYTAD